MSVVLAGRELAAAIRSETAARAAELTAAGPVPTLAVVTATGDEASAWYVRTLARTAAKVGIACDVHVAPRIEVESNVVGVRELLPRVGFAGHFPAPDLENPHSGFVEEIDEMT